MRRGVLALLLGLAGGAWARGQTFEFQVRHRHVLSDCRGTLEIGPAGVTYRTSHPRDGRSWRYEEIQVVRVDAPTRLAIVSFEDQKRFLGKDRTFAFELVAGTIPPATSALLLDKVRRPLVVAVLPAALEAPAYAMRAKHLRTLGGAMGVLRVHPDCVVFESQAVGDSRVWRLGDIERVSLTDRFRVEVTGRVPKAGGPTEVYRFELLEEVPAGLYDYLWPRLHPSAYQPVAAR